ARHRGAAIQARPARGQGSGQLRRSQRQARHPPRRRRRQEARVGARRHPPSQEGAVEMNAKKTPLQQVNEDHGGKGKLVDAILSLVETGEEAADDAKARLLKASNKKLLRLQAVATTIKDKFGSPEKLVDAVAQKLGRAKDSDFVARLKDYTPARLLDMAR